MTTETHRDILQAAYRDFNARNLEAVLSRMSQDVVWPNGMEGGYVHGHAGVRDYWTRQWAMIDPHVEPVEINEDEEGRYIVRVHQVVRDLAGNLLVDQQVRHAYRLKGDLIVRMDIE